LLQQLSNRQEEYRGLLIDLQQRDDKTFQEGVLTNADDITVNVATVFDAMFGEEEDPISEQKLLYAMEFLDHLDTLNLKVVPKWRRG